MNKAGGFITLHRQILDWEWYKNINTKVLFIHLLLNANFKDSFFEGKKILRGQLVTSLPSLAEETGLSVRQVRVSLDHLILTGEVTNKSYSKYRVITISRYDEYQDDDRQNDSQMTGRMTVKRQTNDSQMTDKWQTNDSQMTASEQGNNVNKGTMKQGNNDDGGTAKRFSPPTIDQVAEYCRERGNQVNPQRFVDYYTSNGWKVGRQQMKDWRAAVRTWEERDRKEGKPVPVRSAAAQQYEQRDYSEREETMEEVLMRLQREGYC